MYKKLIVIFSIFFIIQIALSQVHALLPDEGTHGLLGLFYKDMIGNAKNFHSFEDVKMFVYDYLVQYPKLSPYYPPLYHLLEATSFAINKTLTSIRILNILITLSTSFVIYKIGLRLELKKTSALVGLIFFLSFSSIFYYADKIIIDMLQILTFSLVVYYYLNIRDKKSLKLKEIVILTILLALAFMTKFYSIFLPPIILIDSFFRNRKLIKYLILSLVLSILIISPYLFLYIKYNFYKFTYYLSRAYEARELPTNWVYFDVFSNFGIFAGSYAAIALIFFIVRNFRNIVVMSWFFVPLLVFFVLENKDFRFAFILIPIYAISCGYLFECMSRYWKKLAMVIVTLFITLQIVNNIYSTDASLHPTEKIIKSIGENDGNILIASEYPVHSSNYMLYANLNDFKNNVLRPCVIEKDNLTDDMLKKWGIRYIIDQNNIIDENKRDMLNIELLKEEKFDNGYVRLFRTNESYDKVDCNFVCVLNGTICKNQGFSNVLSLISNRTSSIVI